MKWVSHCIKNRLVVYLLAIALCLLGLFCLSIIPISPFPTGPSNQIHITLSYPGANAQTVQTQVTSKVEYALLAVPNVENISAQSFNGLAIINLTLNSNKESDMLQTEMLVSQAIASSNLPSVVGQPSMDTSSWYSSLISYVVLSDKVSIFDINNFIRSQLRPKFSSISGVLTDSHNQNPVISIRLIPEKLAEYHLNPIKVDQLIDASFKSSPLGSLYLSEQLYLLSMSHMISSMQGFQNLIIGYHTPSGGPIYLRDIATIKFAPRDVQANDYTSYNGHIAEGIDLYTASSANPFQVAKTTQNYVKSISKNLPADLKIITSENMAGIMLDSFHEVALTILISSLLVMLIALIFLGRLKTTLIPIVTIPVCLLGTIIFITLLGFTLNILTLLAMVIAVGLVVDDAIVVVENIIRHLESGMNKHQAILHGTSDIALTIVGITLTLLAVYLPISFCSGDLMMFLKAFAVPLAAAVFISGIVALTLTPVMCMQLIVEKEPNNYQIKFQLILNKVISIYQHILKFILSKFILALLVILVLISVGIYFGLKNPRKVFPDDPGGKIVVQVSAAPQDNIDALHKKLQLFSSFYKNKHVKYYSMDIGKDFQSQRLTAKLGINYKAKYLHQIPHYKQSLDDFVKKNHMQNISVQMRNFSSIGGDHEFQFVMYGNDSISHINAIAEELTKIMKRSAIFSFVDNTINLPHKQMEFNLDASQSAKFGIYRSDIQQLLATYYGGYTLNNNFTIAGLSVPVVVGLNQVSLQDPSSINKLQIQSPVDNKFYPLNQFVSLTMVAKPIEISSFQNHPSVSIEADFSKSSSVSDAIKFVNGMMASDAPSLQYQYQGNAKVYLQGNHQTLLILCLGLICIYFLLAIIFKNLVDPFIILLTVPFSVVGGAFTLYIIGGSLNLYSTLALITLIGLITKHGVLIVQFANQKLRQGVSVNEAIMEATHHRFRPILMTTLAMSLGALPLALSQNQMYVARRDLSIVLIGGLIIGTLFSLIIVPLIYTLIKKVEKNPHGMGDI